MSRYAQLPPDFPQPPVVMWAVAAELEQLARDIGAGRVPAPSGPDGRPLSAAQHLDVARQVRVSAMVGALAIDAVPSMWEGWVLAPHPLKIRQHGVDAGAEACVPAVHFPVHHDLDASVDGFYRALDAAVRGCPNGPSASPEPARLAEASCVPCVRWAARYLAAVSVVS